MGCAATVWQSEASADTTRASPGGPACASGRRRLAKISRICNGLCEPNVGSKADGRRRERSLPKDETFESLSTLRCEQPVHGSRRPSTTVAGVCGEGHWELSELPTKLSNNALTVAQRCGSSESGTDSSCVAISQSLSFGSGTKQNGLPNQNNWKIPTSKRNSVIFLNVTHMKRKVAQEMVFLSLNAVGVESESLSATLCSTKAFSEYLMESILTFVEAQGHNVEMLHSDQEPVLVQLLKAWIVFGRSRAHLRERLGQSTQQSWRGDREAHGTAAVLCTYPGERGCRPGHTQDQMERCMT